MANFNFSQKPWNKVPWNFLSIIIYYKINSCILSIEKGIYCFLRFFSSAELHVSRIFPACLTVALNQKSKIPQKSQSWNFLKSKKFQNFNFQKLLNLFFSVFVLGAHVLSHLVTLKFVSGGKVHDSQQFFVSVKS